MDITRGSLLEPEEKPKYNIDRLFDPDKIADAEEEMSEFENYVIVIPSMDFNKVQELYRRWNELPITDRLHCDELAMKIFRKTNQQIYDLLKHIHYSHDNYESMIDEIDEFGRRRLVQECGIHQELKNVITEYSGDDISNTQMYHIHQNKMLGLFDPENCSFKDMQIHSIPMLTPGEMLEMGAYTDKYGIGPKSIGGMPIKEWYDHYCALFDGVKTKQFLEAEPARLEYLQKHCDNKQAMIDLGCNPYVNYDQGNQYASYQRIADIIDAKYDKCDIVDMTSFVEDTQVSDNEVIEEDTGMSGVHPIFLVFAAGQNWFNKITEKMTGSVYTHVSIGFDYKLTNLYSFFIAHSGFGTESIKVDFKHDKYVNVVCYFVGDNQYKKMKHEISSFNKNKGKTSYGFRNFINCLTKVKNENSFSMVCSGFVTYMMKIGDMAPTSKSFSVVSPGHLRRAIARNTKLRAYNIYKGPAALYNPKKVKKQLNQLLSSQISEEISLDKLDKDIKDLFKEIVEPYISTEIIQEVKPPFEFDDNGDLLIYKKDIDFEKEYANSHRLLIQYNRSANYEGMKRELAKLQYMNNILEDRIYHNKSKNKQADIKVRARILNDFNKYMKIVLDHEKDFDFDQYYRSTPYGDDSIRIKKSTVNGVIDAAKRFLRP